MPTIVLQKTKFVFSILPLKFLSGEYWAKAEIILENEHIHYNHTEKHISSEALEEWIFCMHRLLAGAYKREYNLSFDEAGLAIDFYPYTRNGAEASRQERRDNDCVMAVRMLMRSKNGAFLGGVYSLLFHREDIEKFAKELRKEYDEIFVKRVHGRGKYSFAGVSPLGYTGCNYWYLDTSNEVNAGDYVWVEMGSHNTRQIVFVDSVRKFTEDTAPYPVHRVKQVLGIATEEELKV